MIREVKLFELECDICGATVRAEATDGFKPRPEGWVRVDEKPVGTRWFTYHYCPACASQETGQERLGGET